MKLLINDKFLDSLIKLPRGIQEKVSDFIRKFRENSKSAAIHLEPISDFKDKDFRTARIDQKYRAVVHVSQAEDLYTLMWVDNHDEAMAWARNRVFQWNTHTQSYQLFAVSETVVPSENTVSAITVDIGAIGSRTDEELIGIGTPESLLNKVKRIRSMGDLERMEGDLPTEVFERLFYLLDGVTIDEVLAEVEQGKIKEAPGVLPMDSPNNLRFLAEISDETLREFLSGDLQKWMLFLHPSQRTLVTGNYKGAIKVSGAAGTGKTVAAMHRAKYLAEHELGRAGKPILFTTFTKSLTRNLEKTLDDLNVSRSIVQLDNLDGFVVSKAKELALIPLGARFLDFPNSKTSIALWEEVLSTHLSQFDAVFLDEEYRKVILQQNIQSDQAYFHAPRTGRTNRVSRKDKIEIYGLIVVFKKAKESQGFFYLEEIQNKLADHFDAQIERPYGHVVADEIQDFSNTELRLLRSLVAEGPNDLFLVGDPLQCIYDRKPNFTKAGINIRGNRSRRLKVNYRTTEEIKRVAYSTITSVTFDDFDGGEESKNGYISLFHGPPPIYEVFAEKGQEVTAMVARILALTSPAEGGNFRLGDICVATRTRDGIKEVRTALHQAKIAYLDMSSESGKLEAGDAVRLSTFHSLKGLEFKVVILADVNKRNFPFRPGDYEGWDAVSKREHDRRELSLMYVAMSRAIHTLVITGTGGKSGALGV